MLRRDVILSLLVVISLTSAAFRQFERGAAGPWDYAGAAALGLIAFQVLMKLVAETADSIWSSRVGNWIRKAAEFVLVLAIIVSSGVFLVGFGVISWNAGWVGIAVPVAVLIPVITIFVVTGGWASVRDKFLSRKKEI